jgi:hypothetical protein
MTMLHTTSPAPVDTVVLGDEAAHREPRRDWQRMALGVGGVAFAVGNLLHPLEHNDAAYQKATWEAAHLVIFFSIPLLVLGLPVLHRALLARVTRPLASTAVAASVAGLIGIAPGCIIEAFVAPSVGQEAMEALESGGMGAVNGIMGTAFLGGTIALGWAIHRAQLRPRGAGLALVASAAMLLGMMSATGPVAGVIIIATTALYGLALTALAAKA